MIDEELKICYEGFNATSISGVKLYLFMAVDQLLITH